MRKLFVALIFTCTLLFGQTSAWSDTTYTGSSYQGNVFKHAVSGYIFGTDALNVNLFGTGDSFFSNKILNTLGELVTASSSTPKVKLEVKYKAPNGTWKLLNTISAVDSTETGFYHLDTLNVKAEDLRATFTGVSGNDADTATYFYYEFFLEHK